jgi:hypothetical protein
VRGIYFEKYEAINGIDRGTLGKLLAASGNSEGVGDFVCGSHSELKDGSEPGRKESV